MLFFLGHYIDEIIINMKQYFYMDENIFHLFCMENDFAKYFAKCRNLFIEIFCFIHNGSSLK